MLIFRRCFLFDYFVSFFNSWRQLNQSFNYFSTCFHLVFPPEKNIFILTVSSHPENRISTNRHKYFTIFFSFLQYSSSLLCKIKKVHDTLSNLELYIIYSSNINLVLLSFNLFNCSFSICLILFSGLGKSSGIVPPISSIAFLTLEPTS